MIALINLPVSKSSRGAERENDRQRTYIDTTDTTGLYIY